MALVDIRDRVPGSGGTPGDGNFESTNPSRVEKGFYYPEPSLEIATRTKEITGLVAGTTTHGIDITLESPINPEEIVDPKPVVIFHGLMGVEAAYDGLRHEIARRGMIAATYTPIRSKGLLEKLNPRNATQPVKLAAKAALGIARVVTQETGSEKIHGLAHSNGTQTAIELALYRMMLMESLSIVAGVGTWRHKFKSMPTKAVDFIVNDLAPSYPRRVLTPGFLRQEVAYIGGDPLLTGGEVYSAGACDRRQHIARAVRLGLPIGLINFIADDFIPIDKVERDTAHIVHDFHRYRDPRARHTAPQDDPSGVAEAYIEQRGVLLPAGTATPIAA